MATQQAEETSNNIPKSLIKFSTPDVPVGINSRNAVVKSIQIISNVYCANQWIDCEAHTKG